MIQKFDDQKNTQNLEKRLSNLRIKMKFNALDGYLVPRADFFQGEYVAASDERLAFITGFSGSAGFCCVLEKRAAIFVDGRYRIQVKQEVPNSYEIVHWPEKKLWEWLKDNISSGIIGYDPDLHTSAEIELLESNLRTDNITFSKTHNLIDFIWKKRPLYQNTYISEHKHKYAGKKSLAKCRDVANILIKDGQKQCVLTDPESISWLLNIRGKDVPRTPVVQACAVINSNSKVDLFINLNKLNNYSLENLTHVTIYPFSEFKDHLRTLVGKTRIDYQKTPISIKDCISDYVFCEDPCILPKAIKNSVELQGTRKAHLRDAISIIRFLAWLDSQKPGKFTEIDAVTKLEKLRRLHPDFQDISFDTIAGSGANGALPHYRVTRKTNRKIQNGEILLVDSGAQYFDGTTDITRSISIGKPSLEQKKFYTLVLKGMVSISKLRFPRGLSGRDIDALARVPLWNIGHDYDHGTGHGVGVYLSVHEGPQRISRANHEILREGMIVSNEPGFYKESSFGIRIENLLIVKKAPSLGNDSKRDMLTFETLSFAPFDRKLIQKSILNAEEVKWIDKYHKNVLSKIKVPTDNLPWLEKATRPLK